VDVSPRMFLWISLGLHVAAGVAVYGKRAPASASALAPTPTQHEPEAVFYGNTFEVPIDMPAPLREEGVVRDEAPSVSPAADVPGAAVPPPSPRVDAVGARSRTDTGGGSSKEESTGGSGIVFGAIGERASVDLATAFTRGFPQAASADPVWATAPYGAAGEATVVLEIDESGALVDSRIEGAPSPALRQGLLRTLALIHARSFTARRLVTRLRVTAHVSPDEVHDGLHGDVFAIGGSFAAAEGRAFFALAIGRRIDLSVSE